jgi:putative acetyltransferase
MGLAPMAVLPERQGEGIGSALVAVGLEILKGMRCPFIVVLGHADYYPRFGFVPASTFGFRCQWEGVPDENFMILVLSAKAVDGIQGELRYRNEFDAAM